jgi:hypothetical protein
MEARFNYADDTSNEDAAIGDSAYTDDDDAAAWEARMRLESADAEVRRLPEPKVDDGELSHVLDDVAAYIRRFVVFKDCRYADVLALWVVHTWAFDVSEATPYIWIASPEMGSGKTRLLEVLEVLVRRPWRVVEPSEAVTFRKIDADSPTLLLDEIDVIFSHDRKGDTQAGLRGIMNAGYRRGAEVPRAENFGRDLANYSIYCPKAFAGIGKLLPDTVVDRSIKVPLSRRRPDERVERFAHRKQVLETVALRARLHESSALSLGYLESWEEWVPETYLLASDRHAEVWEPLFAIAEAAGLRWPEHARELAAWTSEQRSNNVPPGTLLLQHVYDEFRGEDRVGSRVLLERLKLRDDGPWGAWWQGGYRDQADLIDLSQRLGEFDVSPKQLRFGADNVRGYERRDFADAWQRYGITQV